MKAKSLADLVVKARGARSSMRGLSFLLFLYIQPAYWHNMRNNATCHALYRMAVEEAALLDRDKIVKRGRRFRLPIVDVAVGSIS